MGSIKIMFTNVKISIQEGFTKGGYMFSVRGFPYRAIIGAQLDLFRFSAPFRTLTYDQSSTLETCSFQDCKCDEEKVFDLFQQHPNQLKEYALTGCKQLELINKGLMLHFDEDSCKVNQVAKEFLFRLHSNAFTPHWGTLVGGTRRGRLWGTLARSARKERRKGVED